MEGKTFYLFRHAMTFASENDIPYGDLDLTTQILEEGRPAIVKLANYLKTIQTDINYSSEFLRCKQTAQIVSEITGKEFTFDKRLNEYYKVTFDELRDKVQSFLNDFGNSDYKVTAICTHGAVIAAIKHLLFDKQFIEAIHLHDYPKTGIIWKIANGQVEEISFREEK